MLAADDLPLSRAAAEIVYGASCHVCREVRRIDLAALRDTLGGSVLVRHIRPHLVCKKCGNRHIIVTTHWLSATTTERMTAHWK